MKDFLLFLCVIAAALAGFSLMNRIDRFIDSHVVSPDEDGEECSGEDGTGRNRKRPSE